MSGKAGQSLDFPFACFRGDNTLPPHLNSLTSSVPCLVWSILLLLSHKPTNPPLLQSLYFAVASPDPFKEVNRRPVWDIPASALHPFAQFHLSAAPFTNPSPIQPAGAFWSGTVAQSTSGAPHSTDHSAKR